MLKHFLMLGMMLFVISPLSFAQADSAHPRLWLNQESLEMYRQWANETNPFYSESLLPLAEQGREAMDAGLIEAGDLGGNSYEDYISENYAALFAFMSLIHPDLAEREDFAQRSRILLMRVIQEAAKGVASAAPFRDPEFSTNDRSRWNGVSFALTVDWIYPILSAEEKALIRSVFLRWASELTVAGSTTMNHPEPLGVLNDPALIADMDAVRWSGNNYYTAHMRNMGMMALAFDASDDPNGELAAYLEQATGAWLYVHDTLLRTDAAGGFGTEGFEYSPQSEGYTAQLLLALYTSGRINPAEPQQLSFENNPFWNDSLVAFAHSLSPARVINPDYGLPDHQPAWYGSGQDYKTPDFIELFGALGIYDDLTANDTRLNAIRWMQSHSLMGGADSLIDRSNDASEFHKAILYFLLFDPNAGVPTDPRPNYPTTWYASGMRRLLSRTDWSETASWFVYNLSWNRVDHQSGNGNGFEFYRNGEYLTKIRVGYDFDYHTSDNMNTLTVQNDPIEQTDFRLMIWERGSQWPYSAGYPPQPIWGEGENYLYAYGDSTALYNSDYENLAGVSHVSRSILWLRPDTIVVYDRAVTNSENRPKSFWLNFPSEAVADGNLVAMTTANGQNLQITALLPTNAAVTVRELQDEVSSSPAHFEPMRYRLQIASDGTADVRFLNVLQATDAGLSPIDAVYADCGDFEGALLGEKLVLFANTIGANPVFNCSVSSFAGEVYIMEVEANTDYELVLQSGDESSILSLGLGNPVQSSAFGVIHYRN
jgi:hypothetical protein